MIGHRGSRLTPHSGVKRESLSMNPPKGMKTLPRKAKASTKKDTREAAFSLRMSIAIPRPKMV